jgi:hypothetical protein
MKFATSRWREDSGRYTRRAELHVWGFGFFVIYAVPEIGFFKLTPRRKGGPTVRTR